MDEHTKLSDALFCALDIETTGVNPVLDRIVEIGIIRFTLKGVVETYQTLVNPERDIPEEVVRIHGITPAMVKDSPLVGTLLDAITEFIGESPLIIQNPRFDIAFLEVAYNHSARIIPPLWAYDTVRLSRKTFPDLPNYRLTTLCESLNITIRHHRALSDAEGCMEVFRKAIACHDRGGTWDFRDLDNLHGGALRAGLSRKAKQKLSLDNKIFLGDVIKIRYMDGNGNITTRRILPKQLIREGRKSYIYAYCYLRDDDRYFNTGRILKIF